LTTVWQGAVLQIALLILGVFMYIPFIKILDKQYLKEEENGDNKEKEDNLSLDDLNIEGGYRYVGHDSNLENGSRRYNRGI
jgi:hypothetical protein